MFVQLWWTCTVWHVIASACCGVVVTGSHKLYLCISVFSLCILWYSVHNLSTDVYMHVVGKSRSGLVLGRFGCVPMNFQMYSIHIAVYVTWMTRDTQMFTDDMIYC